MSGRITSRIVFTAFMIGVHVAVSATADVVDDFSDGGVVLNTTPGNLIGSEGPSTALGGWRAFYFHNTYGTFATLTLDEDEGFFRIASDGLAQSSIGYGWRLSPGGSGLQAGLNTVMNADFSCYSAFRFHIRENTAERLRLIVSLRTSGGGTSSTPQLTVTTPAGQDFILPFSSISVTSGGGVNYADVDHMTITVYNGFVGATVSIGPIELVPLPELLGDINGDCTVNFLDRDLFVGVLLGTNTDPEHISRSDLNGDGEIDARDVAGMIEALTD